MRRGEFLVLVGGCGELYTTFPPLRDTPCKKYLCVMSLFRITMQNQAAELLSLCSRTGWLSMRSPEFQNSNFWVYRTKSRCCHRSDNWDTFWVSLAQPEVWCVIAWHHTHRRKFKCAHKRYYLAQKRTKHHCSARIRNYHTKPLFFRVTSYQAHPVLISYIWYLDSYTLLTIDPSCWHK